MIKIKEVVLRFLEKHLQYFVLLILSLVICYLVYAIADVSNKTTSATKVQAAKAFKKCKENNTVEVCYIFISTMINDGTNIDLYQEDGLK